MFKPLFIAALLVSGACGAQSPGPEPGSEMLSRFDQADTIHFYLRTVSESAIPVGRDIFDDRWDLELGFRCRQDCAVQLSGLRQVLESAHRMQAACEDNVAMIMELTSAGRVTRYYVDDSGRCVDGPDGSFVLGQSIYARVRVGIRGFALSEAR
jgi:hypothetical protein